MSMMNAVENRMVIGEYYEEDVEPIATHTCPNCDREWELTDIGNGEEWCYFGGARTFTSTYEPFGKRFCVKCANDAMYEHAPFFADYLKATKRTPEFVARWFGIADEAKHGDLDYCNAFADLLILAETPDERTEEVIDDMCHPTSSRDDEDIKNYMIEMED